MEQLPPEAIELAGLLMRHSVAEVSRLLGVPRRTLRDRLHGMREVFARCGLGVAADRRSSRHVIRVLVTLQGFKHARRQIVAVRATRQCGPTGLKEIFVPSETAMSGRHPNRQVTHPSHVRDLQESSLSRQTWEEAGLYSESNAASIAESAGTVSIGRSVVAWCSRIGTWTARRRATRG
ncbi:hypothetical protein [Zavarzinella formosa]|uniref:hypothetical protein n=1 Tax=Zavarzinella formosa TaxID=360055 RepID=UPI000364BECD|nr:hypothetical protein [Zavarzinella formosa]